MLIVESVITLHISADYAFGHFLTEKVGLRMQLRMKLRIKLEFADWFMNLQWEILNFQEWIPLSCRITNLEKCIDNKAKRAN